MTSSKREKVIGLSIPSLEPSGGVSIALSHCLSISQFCQIYIILPNRGSLGNYERYESILQEMNAEIVYVSECEIDFDLIIFTFWTTILEIQNWGIRSRKWIHFCQSLEDRFLANPKNIDLYNLELAQSAYMFPIDIITEASWILDTLRQRRLSSVRYWFVPNPVVLSGVPRKPEEKWWGVSRDQLVIVVEGEGTWLKGVEDAFRGLAEVTTVSILVHVIGNSLGNLRETQNIKYHHHGKLSQQIFHEIISSSDVLIKMSHVEGMFGPPLEAFSLGTTCITSAVTGAEEYIKHLQNSIVVGIGDYVALSKWIEKLHNDRDFLKKLTEGAIETYESWPKNRIIGNQFLEVIQFVLKSNESPKSLNEYLTEREEAPVILRGSRIHGNSKIARVRYKFRITFSLIRRRDWTTIKHIFKRKYILFLHFTFIVLRRNVKRMLFLFRKE